MPLAVPATIKRPTGESTIVYVMAMPFPPRRYAAGVIPRPVGRRSYTRLIDP
jgi:hypothetical protein